MPIFADEDDVLLLLVLLRDVSSLRPLFLSYGPVHLPFRLESLL